MKLIMEITLLAVLLLLAPASMADTAKYSKGNIAFVGTDASLGTNLCLAAVSDRVSLIKDQLPGNVVKNRGYMSMIAKKLNCNGVNVTVFAYQYGANKTGDFLNHYNRVLGESSIEDLAVKRSDKPMVIYISSR